MKVNGNQYKKRHLYYQAFGKGCIDKIVNWLSIESFSVAFIIIHLYVLSVHCNSPLTFKLSTFYGALMNQ